MPETCKNIQSILWGPGAGGGEAEKKASMNPDLQGKAQLSNRYIDTKNYDKQLSYLFVGKKVGTWICHPGLLKAVADGLASRTQWNLLFPQ